MKHIYVAVFILSITCNPAFCETIHATAYTENPRHSASGGHLHRGTIAVSQDLLKCGFTFGKRVRVRGVGVCTVVDTMPRQWHRRVDVWMPNRQEALDFGIIKTTIELVEEE